MRLGKDLLTWFLYFCLPPFYFTHTKGNSNPGVENILVSGGPFMLKMTVSGPRVSGPWNLPELQQQGKTRHVARTEVRSWCLTSSVTVLTASAPFNLMSYSVTLWLSYHSQLCVPGRFARGQWRSSLSVTRCSEPTLGIWRTFVA